MIVSISEQAHIFFIAVTAGVIIGIFYDLFRIIRKIFPHPNWLIQLEDLIYWITISAFMFFVLFNKNYGEIRGFVLLGALLGNIIYFFTISIVFMKFATWIIYWTKKIIKTILRILFIPIKLILKILYYPYKWISYPFKFLRGKIKIIMNKSKNKVKRKSKQILKELYIIYKKI
ncbi:spore cortex biosynthesis protein YabQ [Defluviitalea phaphyphila]|uniref:spore cortex biosynthesis protein YabQ n=1 Tax=Defluviitalea phaphyphila TaxID=1473580 RepID=UPI00073141FA|nr:spore cortex biosynthesis protein YabQ [Defluviitalea phaphyphila]